MPSCVTGCSISASSSRQGIQYALARRFVSALIPTLGAVLLIDLLAHRAQPLGVMLQLRWWWFSLVGAALLVVRSRRERWLKGVDRRFFRERYDAERLLRSIAQQIARASSLEAVAPSVCQQIAEALHPEFVSVLMQTPGEPMFRALATGSGIGPGSGPLPASLAVIGVLSVLRKPLAVSLGDTAWVVTSCQLRSARSSSRSALNYLSRFPARRRAVRQ